MTFVNATMLAGISGAMLPLTLHLFGRARHKGVQWGAMLFLDGTMLRQSHVARLKEYVLLGLRMALVATLAIALSRPIISPTSTASINEPTSTIIIIDRSPSMTFGENGPQRKDVAARAALAVLATLHPGDEAAVLFSPQMPLPGSVDFTVDLQAVASRIGDMTPGLDRADIAAALNAASTMLKNAHSPNRRIVLVTDRQAVNWRDINSAFAAAWKPGVLDQLGRPPQFTVIPVGSSEAGNVAIESVQPASLPVLKDMPTEIEVRIRNFDTVPAVGIPLSVQVSNAVVYKTTLNLEAGASTVVRCAMQFKNSGAQTLLARLDPAGLTFDDSLEVGIDVMDPISVLVVAGNAEAPGLRDSAAFLRAALTPYTSAHESTADLARVEVVGADNWPEISRKKYQVVVLANVPRLSSGQARQIEQFAYGGGGVLIAPGSLSRVDDYNSYLWREGAGILPAELESPTVADGSQATTLQGVELNHPIFKFLAASNELVPKAQIGRYFPTRSPESRGKVLGRYATGKAFLIETAYGRGRALLITTPLDAEWSNLPFANSYLPLVQSAVRYLASASLPERNLSPGQPIVMQFSGPTAPRVLISGPALAERQVDLLPVGDGYELRFFNTSRPGTYRVRAFTESETRVAPYYVQTPRDESDLAGLTEEQWTEYQRLLGFRRAGAEPDAVAAGLLDTDRIELWPWLIGLTMVCAVFEMLLARIWSDPALEVAA